MKQFSVKLKLIFVPFLWLTAATVIIYTFLHWLLFIEAHIYPLDEIVLNLFGPMAVPAIPVLIWLRPRIKLLDLKSKGKDPLTGYLMFAGMAMVAPNVIAQEYLVTATGKLTKLDQMSQINNRPETKYYTVKHFYIDKKLVAAKTTFETSGKNNTDFDMAIYAPCPIFDYDHSPVDTQASLPPRVRKMNVKLPNSLDKILIVLDGRIIARRDLNALNHDSVRSAIALKSKEAVPIYGNAARFGALVIQTKHAPVILPRPLVHKNVDANAGITPIAWLAVKYTKTISNRLSQEEKQSRYKEFAQESQRDFDAKQLDKFVYLNRMGPSSDLKSYQAAIASKNYETSTLPVILLEPVNEPFEARNGHKLPWIFGAFGIGAFIFLVMLLFKPLKVDVAAGTDATEVEEEEEKSSALKEIKFLFFPREGFYVTPILIDINLAVFIVMACAGLGFLTFQGTDLLKYGANYRPYVENGQYWRLLTNMFLHGGLMHVLLNMYGLLFVGIFLEPVMGRLRYTVAYFATGIIASAASVWWHPATISIGASGAIFGVYGVFLALLTTKIFPNEIKRPFLINTSIFVVLNLVAGLGGGIDNAAHIGGLVSGVLLGYAFYPAIKKRVDEKNTEEEATQF